jgi:hypothetical protein
MKKRQFTEAELRDAARVFGARGGAASRGMKGFAKMSMEDRKRISAMAVAARRAKRNAN